MCVYEGERESMCVGESERAREVAHERERVPDRGSTRRREREDRTSEGWREKSQKRDRESACAHSALQR